MKGHEEEGEDGDEEEEGDDDGEEDDEGNEWDLDDDDNVDEDLKDCELEICPLELLSKVLQWLCFSLIVFIGLFIKILKA